MLGIDGLATGIELAKDSTIYTGKGIDFELRDIETTRLGATPYGLILCKYVYAFIQGKEVFVQNVAQCMSATSTFVLVSPSQKHMPANKQNITVAHEDMLAALGREFSKIETCERNSDIYYFCKK